MRQPDRRLRVLVVDDDPDDHLLTGAALADARRARFHVEHAYTPEEARAKIQATAFDACLLDYALGPIDGVQLFAELRTEGFEVPTILLSGQNDDEIADSVLDVGLADYLEKGSSPSALERAILYAIERDADRRQIVALNQGLEQRVWERTHELESFCYTVSHDLRAPLRAINVTSAILKEDFAAHLPEPARLELDRQAEASARLGRLIDDLLHFVRLGQTTVKRVPVNLTELTGLVAEELRIHPEVPSDLWTTGDPTLLRLLIMNLLDNAVKFSGGKESRIEVGREGDAFFVRDHGIGFDPRYAGKLFRPFERLHREGDYPGTGIGLANVKRIVERHGGKVWAEGRPDEGATFFFTLG